MEAEIGSFSAQVKIYQFQPKQPPSPCARPVVFHRWYLCTTFTSYLCLRIIKYNIHVNQDALQYQNSLGFGRGRVFLTLAEVSLIQELNEPKRRHAIFYMGSTNHIRLERIKKNIEMSRHFWDPMDEQRVAMGTIRTFSSHKWFRQLLILELASPTTLQPSYGFP